VVSTPKIVHQNWSTGRKNCCQAQPENGRPIVREVGDPFVPSGISHSLGGGGPGENALIRGNDSPQITHDPRRIRRRSASGKPSADVNRGFYDDWFKIEV